MAFIWNAETYSKFIYYRTRPAQELLANLPKSCDPQNIFDLGCGPGNSTILLREKYPHAQLTGVDFSEDMLNQARKNYPAIHFRQADIANFSLTQKVDLLFSNAALQWLDHHELLLPNYAAQLNHHGVLAIQIPNNFHSPAHQSMIFVLEENKNLQTYLSNLRFPKLMQPLYSADFYYHLLTQSHLHSIDIWETEYYQEMPNHEAIFEWMSGTGLRPILSDMNEYEKIEFTDSYMQYLKAYYPITENKTVLFPFKRLFMVGVKK